MAGIVGGSIAASWSPVGGNGEADSMKFSRARSRSDLSREQGLDFHPDTKSDDPIVVEQRMDTNHPPSQSMQTTPAFGLGPFGDQPQAVVSDDKKKGPSS